MKLRNFISVFALLGSSLFAMAQTAPYPPAFQDSRPGGRYLAAQYNNWSMRVWSWPGGTGALTFTTAGSTVDLGDGRKIQPFSTTAKICVDSECVTPSAVSGCYLGSSVPGLCSITATFSNAHSNASYITSGTEGLQEAIIDANAGGGGTVVLDARWQALTNTTYLQASQIIATATVYPNVVIEDTRQGLMQYWTPFGGSTVMTTPTTLTSATVTAQTTPSGAFANSAYTVGVSCVDVFGQEGTVSTGYAITPAAGSSSLIFTAPTNCVGAIGYKIYSTLAGASYPLAYQIPLVAQPTVLGAPPVSNGVCALQTINLNVVACAVANTTYGQAASNATVTAIPVNTSPIAPETTTISTTSVYVPNPGGRTTYSYAPSANALSAASQAFPISAAAGTTVPAVLGTINMYPGFMNLPGRTIEICGKAVGVSTATIVSIAFQWDALGQNTAGKGIVIGNLGLTPATAFATTEAMSFCEDFQTTVASATATGGSIAVVGGYIATSGVATAAAGQGAGFDATGAATSGLNLANEARINITYTHTNNTDGTAPTLYGLTVKIL